MNKVNILDRLYFVSLIFAVPFFVELTDKFGVLMTTGLVCLYAVISAKGIKKLSSYFYREGSEG